MLVFFRTSIRITSISIRSSIAPVVGRCFFLHQWCPSCPSQRNMAITCCFRLSHMNPRLRLHSWKGNVSTWTNSPCHSLKFTGESPHPTDFLDWKMWKNHGCHVSIRMFLSAASFLFWAPAIMSENLSHAKSKLNDNAANFRSTNLKTQHSKCWRIALKSAKSKQTLKISTYQSLSKY